MCKKLKQLILNRSFWLGVFICIALFSRYIFGDDNLLEQLGELKIKNLFGIDIDFSPENER
jgi:hypothetical protein